MAEECVWGKEARRSVTGEGEKYSPNHIHTRSPIVASQFFRALPSHHMWPSLPMRPHSASHCFMVSRLALSCASGT